MPGIVCKQIYAGGSDEDSSNSKPSLLSARKRKPDRSMGKVFFSGISIRSGAGIVADSVPDKEFEECRNKAKAVVNAVLQAEEGVK